TGAHEVRLHRERADVLALAVGEGLPAREDVLPRRGQRAALAAVARVHARAEHVVHDRFDGVRRGPADARSGRARAAWTVARASAGCADVRPAIATRAHVGAERWGNRADVREELEELLRDLDDLRIRGIVDAGRLVATGAETSHVLLGRHLRH